VREHDRSDEQADDTEAQHAADRAHDDHEGWHARAATEQERLQHVVDQAYEEAPDREGNGDRRASGREHVNRDGQEHDRRGQLRDREDQHEQRPGTRRRNAGERHADPGQNGLDQRYADHALGDAAHGVESEIHERLAALRGEALGHRQERVLRRFGLREKRSRHGHRKERLQHAQAEPAERAHQPAPRFPELR
jgi:hypothetical protein